MPASQIVEIFINKVSATWRPTPNSDKLNIRDLWQNCKQFELEKDAPSFHIVQYNNS